MTDQSKGSIRVEIAECGIDVPEMVTLRSAQITDHDSISAHPVKNVWPPNLAPSTLKLHQHFCELVFAWNLNPYRRDTSTVSIDESVETFGVSRFHFDSQTALNDFLDYYALDDFVVRKDSLGFLTLTNKFHPEKLEAFFAIYRDAMAQLAVIEEERYRAIRMDGNKVGHVNVDHFNARETYELMRIKHARFALGASRH